MSTSSPFDGIFHSPVVQHKGTITSEILVLQLPLHGLSEICIRAPFEREIHIFLVLIKLPRLISGSSRTFEVSPSLARRL